MMIQNRRQDAKTYFQRFMTTYDINHPAKVKGRQIPALIMGKDIYRGGIKDTSEACYDWIMQNPDEILRTKFYIERNYQLDLRPETDPRRFSLLMMEYELYMMLLDVKEIEKGWNDVLCFGKRLINKVCQSNGLRLCD